jgi:CubicO group peptidase (beta-lactamase class C family)
MKTMLLQLLAFGLALNCRAQTQEEQRIKIDAFLRHTQQLNKFNGTVLIAQKDKIIFQKGYGFLNAEKKITNDPNSIFQIYSITKTFTSTLVFQLIEQHKLTLTDKLSQFYPQFPNGDRITIEHLLTHTSGINDNADQASAPETEEYRVALFGRNKPNFAPGEGWAYCNGGYQLLGYIIGRVTGMPYEAAIRKYIFTPLQMTNSGFDFKNLNSPHKTTAYSVFQNHTKKLASLYDSTGPFAAGSIYSTVGDLYKYYEGLSRYQVISQSSFEQATTPGKTNSGYGYGWQLNNQILNKKVISHSGGAAGFRSNFAMIPEDSICIAILNNHENASPEYLTKRIVEILNNVPFEVPADVKLPLAILQKLTGLYSIKEPHAMLITISILDSRLALAIGNQAPTPLLAKNETTFLHEEAEATLQFQPSNTEKPGSITVNQGTRQMIAKRVEPSWGLLGDALPKGWDDSKADIPLIEQKKNIWVLPSVTLAKGLILFRLNNDWAIHYGDTGMDGILDKNGENIKVEDGTYTLTLDLRDSAKPIYRLKLVKK